MNRSRWTQGLLAGVLLTSTPAAFGEDVEEILFLDRTYEAGPLTIEDEVANLLLVRFAAGSDSVHAGRRIDNVPLQRIRYLVYPDRAVSVIDGQRVGAERLSRRAVRPYGGLRYAGAASFAMAAYQLSRLGPAQKRVDQALDFGDEDLARVYRGQRRRNVRYAALSLAAGFVTYVLGGHGTYDELTLVDGTIISLHRDGRYTFRGAARGHRGAGLSLVARLGN